MHIGLIGGIGPAATISYYQRLSAAMRAAGHSLELTMVNADVDTLLANNNAGNAAAQAQVYAELMGHHLSQGFGATSRQDLADGWYAMGISAIEAGQAAVFAPGQPERTALIKAAVMGPENAMNAPVQPASALPTFKIGE